RERVLRRARLYVTRYQVRQEGASGAEYRVALSAWVDTARVRVALTELGVALDAPPAPAPGVRARPRLVVLAGRRMGDGVLATCARAATGDGAAGGEVAGGVARELREYGFDLVPATGVDVPVGEAGGAWPLDADDA